MSSQKTEYYELNQWLPTDQVLRTDFNADNAKIDVALGTLAAAVEQCGNCKIVYGSYTGTGEYGNVKRSSLTFSGEPLLVIVQDFNMGGRLVLVRGSAISHTYYANPTEPMDTVSVTWSTPNKVIWSSGSVLSQANYYGMIYYYVAFLAADA